MLNLFTYVKLDPTRLNMLHLEESHLTQSSIRSICSYIRCRQGFLGFKSAGCDSDGSLFDSWTYICPPPPTPRYISAKVYAEQPVAVERIVAYLLQRPERIYSAIGLIIWNTIIAPMKGGRHALEVPRYRISLQFTVMCIVLFCNCSTTLCFFFHLILIVGARRKIICSKL